MKPYARMILMLACMISTALILQGAFDTSDHAKSERIVKHFRGAGDGAEMSLQERVEHEAPGGAWSSEITAGCRGIVRVTYAAPSGVWRFDYDVPQHLIHPANPAAERVLAVIAAAAKVGALDGGAPRPPDR